MDDRSSSGTQYPMLGTDPREFERLVRTHTASLLRFATNRIKDPAIAEDLVQTTLIAAWEARDRFSGQSSPRTWLFSILKHKIADHYRKAYRDPSNGRSLDTVDDRFDERGHWLAEHKPQPWGPDDGTDEGDALERFLTHCLDRLPTHWRAALEMKYLLDRDAAAICKELGITATNYWQQLHRAKLRMRECLEHQRKNDTHQR
ncbi:MAG: sigma-70 family RNA polymerase sigma factor [Flavobacteriales bacterium]|nr:sigma-70 family RNA polymerase sigma factor [Flavobacteriales bacterium]MBK9512548.1 sigma-70 family RNA polymerase sigma factor [Flavobacteriales bacterium]MBP7449027.1 sigma-70 family RNA polymerase sigma factor [Flavobacteriales bacterium]